MSIQIDPAYQAAIENVAGFPVPQPGFLFIDGRDQADFLQRQTTNDIQLLQPHRALPTVLTNPSARILDVLYLIQETDAIQAITLPGRGSSTGAYLKSRIFFKDQVRVEDHSPDYQQIDLCGPRADRLVEKLGFTHLPGGDELISAELDGETIFLMGSTTQLWLGVRLLAPQSTYPSILAVFDRASVPLLTPELYHVLRVEAGLPWSGFELNDNYTPLETGLDGAISPTKGCYTGQEVIARQITYDKITQRMCGLHLEASAIPGTPVWGENRQIGTVTSAVRSPRFGWLALAILRRPNFAPGTELQVGIAHDTSTAARVSELPFQ